MASFRPPPFASLAVYTLALAVGLGGAGWPAAATVPDAAPVAVAGPAAATAGRFASGPVSSQPGGSYAKIAVSRTRVWVFTQAGSSAPGSIIELSPATGRQIRTLRESTPGQTPWVVAAYQDHPWTTIVPADGLPELAEVSASGAFTHIVKLAAGVTPDGAVAGAVALAGSHLWAATASPAGLLQVSASSGAKISFLRWPRALRGFSPQGMVVSGTQIWMTDGQCEVARVTTSTDRATIFRLPSRDCQVGTLPARISVAGGHVWVQAWNSPAGYDGTVAELNASNGHLIRLLPRREYGWNYPTFVAAGRYLWVTSTTGGYHDHGSVTELSASTGRLVHFFSASKYHFNQPFAIAAWGSHVWILNLHSVTKL